MSIFAILILIAVLAISITFHEFMHGYVAYKLGDDTAKHSGRLTLNPLAHIDPFLTVLLPLMLALSGLPPFGAAKPVPFNPSRLRNGETGMVMVALAGPLTNLALAAIVGFITQVVVLPPALFAIAGYFVIINLAFFVFNMIPFPPLDGSRVLYVLAPEPVRQVMRTIEASGLIGVGLFILATFTFLSPLLTRAIQILLLWLAPNVAL